MRLKILIATILFVLLSINISLCQSSSFGITGNIGLSKIQSNLESLSNEKNKLALSSSFGFIFEKK